MELLTGQGLFRSSTVFGVVSAQIAKSFLPPSTYNEQVPKALDELIMATLNLKLQIDHKVQESWQKELTSFVELSFQREETSTAEHQFDQCQRALELVYAGKSKEAEQLLNDMAQSANSAPAQFLLGKIGLGAEAKVSSLGKGQKRNRSRRSQ